MRNIFVSDFTLKNLAGERKNPLLFREKTAIAAAIDSMGVDAIELAPIASLKEDTIVYKTISSTVKNAALCLPAGTSEQEIDAAWEAISTAAKPCLQIVLPLSTVQMEYTYHLKSDKMLPVIESLVKYAKSKCDNVEFIAVDATRAEPEFLAIAIKAAEQSGATAITLSDNAGNCLPEEFADFIKSAKSVVSVPLYVKVSDALKMANATAVAAVNAGADGVKTVIVGKGELRADSFAQAITIKGESLGVSTNLITTKLHSDIHTLTKKIKSTEPEEAEAAAEVGADILLDGESTPEEIAEAASCLGYTLSREDIGNVERGLKRVCEKKGSVGTRELEALIASYTMRAPSTYHLESYTATTSNLSPSMAHVILTKDGSEEISGSGVGDGPVDAAFGAIEQAIGFHYDLEEFAINTVTQGKESLGSALIKLRNNGKLYSGNGISTDIVGACIRAYINALNKIVYDENEQ